MQKFLDDIEAAGKPDVGEQQNNYQARFFAWGEESGEGSETESVDEVLTEVDPEADRDTATENEVMNVIPEEDLESEPVVTSSTTTWQDTAEELELTWTGGPESVQVNREVTLKQSGENMSDPETITIMNTAGCLSVRSPVIYENNPRVVEDYLSTKIG